MTASSNDSIIEWMTNVYYWRRLYYYENEYNVCVCEMTNDYYWDLLLD